MTNPKRLTDEQREMATECLFITRKIAGEAAQKNRRIQDEIHGAALFGLLEASRTFQPGHGATLWTWTKRIVQQHICQEIKYQSRKQRDRRLDPAHWPAGYDHQAPPPVPVPDTTDADRLLELIQDRQARSICGRLFTDMTEREVADQEGMNSVSSVRLACIAGYEALREIFSGPAEARQYLRHRGPNHPFPRPMYKFHTRDQEARRDAGQDE